MSRKKYTLILASKSPRRSELLGLLGIPFKTIPAGIREDPEESALKLAELKGEYVFEQLKKKKDFNESFFPLVVSSDTQVRLGEQVYGKPSDQNDAARILTELKGKTHEVLTAVHLIRIDSKTKEIMDASFYCTSRVTFDDFSDQVLTRYLATGDYLDKAGAYGIQGPAVTFISRLEGSYSNVVGFPLTEFIKQMGDFLQSPKSWGKYF